MANIVLKIRVAPIDHDVFGRGVRAELELDASWGLAAHAGVDFKIGDKGAIRVDARWIDIDTDVSVEGEKLGTVNIDPLVYGVAYVFSF